MKKSGGAKRGGKGGELTGRDRLEEDLRAAIGRIDEEGLVFLLEQANVLIHNARVEELRRKRGDEAPGESAEAPPRASVAVEEAADKKAFFITLGSARKILSLAEMQGLVRLCRAAESGADAGRRLFAAFSRERRDILMDAGIGSASSPLLAALYEAVLARYPPPAA